MGQGTLGKVEKQRAHPLLNRESMDELQGCLGNKVQGYICVHPKGSFKNYFGLCQVISHQCPMISSEEHATDH